MISKAIVSALAVSAMLLPISERVASAQLFPSDKMTAAFRHNVDSFALSNGGAFVSICQGPEKGEMAILIVPLGTHSGSLSLWSFGKVYNGAGLEIRAGKFIIVEGGGGDWSRRKLQFYADKLAESEFQLDSPNHLRSLLTTRARNACPEFKYRVPEPLSRGTDEQR